jgi:hypothetical protein
VSGKVHRVVSIHVDPDPSGEKSCWKSCPRHTFVNVQHVPLARGEVGVRLVFVEYLGCIYMNYLPQRCDTVAKFIE